MTAANGIRDDVDDIIKYLNYLIVLDEKCITNLIDTRVPCNDAITNHQTVQVGAASDFSVGADGYVVGLLGILNGYFGAYLDGSAKGKGAISAWREPDGRITAFTRLNNSIPVQPITKQESEQQ